MADFDLPSDLVELKREWFAVDDHCRKLAGALPSNVAVLEGKAERDMEGEAALAEARAERLRILEQINSHPWWEEKASDRHQAWIALAKAARS
ncbi:hypothetical protein GCM10010404_81310 [Nonomuraea africana]